MTPPTPPTPLPLERYVPLVLSHDEVVAFYAVLTDTGVKAFEADICDTLERAIEKGKNELSTCITIDKALLYLQCISSYAELKRGKQEPIDKYNIVSVTNKIHDIVLALISAVYMTARERLGYCKVVDMT